MVATRPHANTLAHSDTAPVYAYRQAKRVAAVPKRPKGEKRSADVIGAGVREMQIATGEVEETPTHMANRSCLLIASRLGVHAA